MSRKRLLPLLALVVSGLVVVAGCPGGGGQAPIDVPDIPDTSLSPQEELKSQLEGLAQDGEMMPGMETMGETIEAIKGADAEKGAALEKDWEALNNAIGNPEQVKAKAKAMLEKL